MATKPEPEKPDPEEVLRRMLNTPPQPRKKPEPEPRRDEKKER